MGIFSDIRAAFETTLVGIPIDVEIAWENVEKEFGLKQEYLRPTLMPITGDVASFGGLQARPNRAHKGFYQIDIFTPLGNGINRVGVISDAIYDLFGSSNLMFGTTKVFIRSISQGKIQRDEARLYSFIEIEYICYDNP